MQNTKNVAARSQNGVLKNIYTVAVMWEVKYFWP